MTEYEPFIYTYVHLDPSEQIGMHAQNTWELSYVIEWKGERHIGGSIAPFAQEDLVLIPPGIQHCWHFCREHADAEGKISNITLFFSKETLIRIGKAFPSMKQGMAFISELKDATCFSKPAREKIASLLNEMRNLPETGRIPYLIGILTLLSSPQEMDFIGKPHMMSPEEQRMDIIKTFIHCNLTREISIDEISAHAGMSKSSFCRFFKKMTGTTFVNYLNKARIDSACGFLQKKGIPVSEAAYRSGFNDIPYFNRVFKKFKGCPPSLYVSSNDL